MKAGCFNSVTVSAAAPARPTAGGTNHPQKNQDELPLGSGDATVGGISRLVGITFVPLIAADLSNKAGAGRY